MENPVTGGPQEAPQVAPKGRRFAAGVIDLIVIPIVLGLFVGLLLLNVPDVVRSIVLVLVNIGWLLFRDAVFSPGRAMVSIKIISLTGGNVTVGQALIRNILLMVPFILVAGYFCEMARVLIPKSVGWRRFVYVVLLVIGLLLMFGGFAAGSIAAGVAALCASLTVVFVLFVDKQGLCEGDRLMDVFAKTRVVSS